jgi:hypothetical protein
MIVATFGTKTAVWRRWGIGAAACAALALAQPTALPASAQTLGQLPDVLGGGEKAGGALGGLGGGLPSLDRASPSNIAGVLQYCVKNKYLGGGAESVGSSVLGKLTGSGKASDDSAFKAGSDGLLQTGNGQTFGLGGGIKEKVTEQVCDMVLEHAQSLL